MVRPGARLADIGTDHAYLPVYLSYKNRISCALASDIASGPLARAKANIENWGQSDKIETMLCPGLKGVECFAPTDIVIAGMGGEQIVSILKEAPLVRNSEIHLILQPMTKQEILREYLSDGGFEFLEEDIVFEEERAYQLILCSYTGKPRELSALEKAVGPLNASRGGGQFVRLLKKKMEQMERAAEGRKQGGLCDRAAEELLLQIREKLEELRGTGA